MYLTGKPSRVGEAYRRRGAKIVVQVNGMRLATSYAGDRRAWQRASIRDFSSEIALTVDIQYAAMLRARPSLRRYASASLKERLAMAGLAL